MTEASKQRFLQLRTNYIKNEFSNLNPQQLQAVLQTEGPMLLLAGAGSGKTTVLIHRIANLIRFGCGATSGEVPDYLTDKDIAFLENLDQAHAAPEEKHRADALCCMHPAAPWRIIAITFTNKAANELKDRLERMLGPEAADIWAMTFHAACCRILRRYIDHLGYDPRFTIYDTADSERVIKDILRERSLDEKSFPPRLILSLISKAKDKLQQPDEFAAQAAAAGDYRLEKIAEVYAAYAQRCKAASAVDFDDIILLTVQLLQQYQDVREYYQEKFRYVMIDEYQDTNHLQDLLASLLTGRRQNICVVGDDDQSIYRFRGATIENILNFEQQFPNTCLIRLEQNYRSTQSILNAANAVIANNQGRKGKNLWTKNGPGVPVTLYSAYDASDEANYIAAKILAGSMQHPYKDYAILYRTNAQSNALEYAMKRQGIPYRVIGGTRFFDRAEVKDMLAYLCVINNRADDLRLARIINNPPRGIGAKTLEMASRLASSSGIPLYGVVSSPGEYPALERAAGKLQAFCQIIEDCAALLGTIPLPDFYDEVVSRTGYAAMLEQKNDVESRVRLDNIRELKSSIVSYLENTDEPSLNGFLEEIALYTDLEQLDSDSDAIVMMTIHAAKGLEFPQVFLSGAEEGLFPGMRAIGEPEEMEEERRLCYVAMTRAKESLTITYAKQRMLYGRTTVNHRSRFVDEIPKECVTGGEDRCPQRREAAPAPRKPRPRHDTLLSAKPQAAASYQAGDMVLHDAFGEGMVISVAKMGNDAMLEIAFDRVGTKKLMANYASQHMHKQA